ncbi:hypothetical protein MTO96_046738, partial [Rhipicephalus appendiculatus]
MCVLVRRGIAFVEHELNVASDIDGTLIEIIPSKGKTAGLYLLNVYSTPSKKGLTHTFDGLFREAMAKASSKPLLICGDFNAPHTHWGYGSDSPKGRRLAELVDDLGLTLLNEPASHTRIGQGVCRDTTPDLSMCVNADEVSWANTFEDLGSDHRILSVVVGRIVEEQASNRKVRIVEWDKFRKTRDREKKEGPIEDIGAWCKEILADVEKATKEIEWTDWREKEAGVRTEMAKLRHKYTDDLEALADEVVRTHLTRPGSLDHPEEVEGHLEGTGLVCAPNKSEILLHRPRKPGRLPKDVAAARQTGVHVTTKEGGRIPTVSKIRVLGLWLEENGANSELVTRLRKK